jgi:hypothetical protein
LGVDNLNTNEYSALIASKSFHDYIPTEMFLVFQVDTMIMSKYAYLVNVFLQYDYVGAPWMWPWSVSGEAVGNGGFSLRRKSKMLEILEKVPYPYGQGEDCYFSTAHLHGPVQVNKPSGEQAKLFSVEQTFSEVTFGTHKPWAADYMFNKFAELYPDVLILRDLQSSEP